MLEHIKFICESDDGTEASLNTLNKLKAAQSVLAELETHEVLEIKITYKKREPSCECEVNSLDREA